MSRTFAMRGAVGHLVGLAALAGVLASAAGCSGTEAAGTTDPADEPTVEVVADDTATPTPNLPATTRSADGREVTVEDVSRIVVLQGNVAEVVFALGLGPNVVGRDISTTFSEADDIPLVTRAHDVSAESVLSLRPTVVLADTDTGPPEALDQIRNVGVPVLRFDPPTDVDGIGERIRSIAAALGLAGEGDTLAESTQAEIDSVAADIASTGGAAAERPRIAFLYMRGQAGVYLLGGPGSGADSMIEAVGGEDAGTAIGLDRAFTPLTSEALVTAAPDLILMTTTGLESVGGAEGLARIPGIAQTPAGRAGQVVTVEDGLLYSFGTRTPEALRQMAEQIETAGTDANR